MAKATSIVRYQPGSKFQAHTHEFGEQIFFLEGTFSDETGGKEGCTIFVKTGQLLI